jgi:dTDP-4-amino-4,6-dideoxygalactose transaminase
VERLQKIADTYGLKLFYDAAHAFGVRLNGTSILNFGDLSMLSFHATKVFNTAEGGALITSDAKLKKRIDFLKNFGFADEVTVMAPGTNGKMNELQAALGLIQLRYIGAEIETRRAIAELYRRRLAGVPGIQMMQENPNATQNYGYFPIFVDESVYPMSRDALYETLKEQGMFGRRYFYPLISEFPNYRGLPSSIHLEAAKSISRKVLCLPIYSSLEHSEVEAICEIVSQPVGRAVAANLY